MDTINTPTVRKKLLKLSAQDPGESRKRWQHVTEALWNKDIEAATDAKHAVRGREEERERGGESVYLLICSCSWKRSRELMPNQDNREVWNGNSR